MISSANCDFRRAGHRLISSSITVLIGVCLVQLHLSRFLQGHQRCRCSDGGTAPVVRQEIVGRIGAEAELRDLHAGEATAVVYRVGCVHVWCAFHISRTENEASSSRVLSSHVVQFDIFSADHASSRDVVALCLRHFMPIIDFGIGRQSIQQVGALSLPARCGSVPDHGVGDRMRSFCRLCGARHCSVMVLAQAFAQRCAQDFRCHSRQVGAIVGASYAGTHPLLAIVRSAGPHSISRRPSKVAVLRFAERPQTHVLASFNRDRCTL